MNLHTQIIILQHVLKSVNGSIHSCNTQQLSYFSQLASTSDCIRGGPSVKLLRINKLQDHWKAAK